MFVKDYLVISKNRQVSLKNDITLGLSKNRKVPTLM